MIPNVGCLFGVFFVIGSVLCEDSDDMVIYEYPPPERYDEAYQNGGDYRDLDPSKVPPNEIPVDLPKNFTNEEYGFILFNRKHMNGVVISENNTIEELQLLLDDSLETKVVVHGWLSSADSYVVNNTIKEYLATRDINAVACDWSTLAGYKLYPVTTYSVAPVGRGVAKLVSRLVEARVASPERLHLIGHSLGAHVMGVAGYTLQQESGIKVSRITGLDPASPMFEHVGGSPSRLDPSDAEFVDVIHTAGGAAGYYGTLGTVDFYPNGGTPVMPGCKMLSPYVIGCSHGMSYRYFDESIANPRGFRAVKCDSWSSFSGGSCDNNTVSFMGDQVPRESTGVYYLKTNSDTPYALD